MTTAIEQAKREMYNRLQQLKTNADMLHLPELRKMLERFEECSETYLEHLRQQYEEMSSTAHSRFESIQSLEAANQELIEQLAKMTESRDLFRNLHQASTHAAIERHAEPATPHQDSGDRASFEQLEAEAMAKSWDGEGLPPVGAVCEISPPYRDHGCKIRVLCHDEGDAICRLIEGDEIGDLRQYMASEVRPIRTSEQVAADRRDNDLNEMVGFVKDHPGGRHGVNHLSQLKIQEEAIIDLYNAGYRKVISKPSCMHSFHAPTGCCTFCGAGK